MIQRPLVFEGKTHTLVRFVAAVPLALWAPGDVWSVEVDAEDSASPGGAWRGRSLWRGRRRAALDHQANPGEPEQEQAGVQVSTRLVFDADCT